MQRHIVRVVGFGLVRMMCLVDRERDMRFAQDDNLLGGWRMGTQLAVCSTQDDKADLGDFPATFSLAMCSVVHKRRSSSKRTNEEVVILSEAKNPVG